MEAIVKEERERSRVPLKRERSTRLVVVDDVVSLEFGEADW